MRIITSTAAVIWLFAAFLIPIGTDIPAAWATPAFLIMSGISATAFLTSARADTLDRQHAIASVLSAGSGLVILWLTSIGARCRATA